ncbi:MAG: hypothetical protein Q7S76_01495 [bacterium]|nr:hypothetical protein [bacterium]
MTATAHALVAGAIAAKFIVPSLTIPLALASHYVMDIIPHWDFGTNWRKRSKRSTAAVAIADTILGITLAYFFFGAKVPPLTLALTVGASLLPDWIETPWYIFFARQNKTVPEKSASTIERLCYRLYKLQNGCHTKATFPLGAITQIVTVIAILLLLK